MHEQLILFGSPGTGKSYTVNERVATIPRHKQFRVTIHPEFLYTDFVGQLLPDVLPDGSTTFSFKEGPFTMALKEAFADLGADVVLVLEELSRGNVAAIFGDIFQLLDRDAHFESRYHIKNKDVADQIPTLAAAGEIYLPSNFSIICTVNTNDQNVYAMDTAFKRRFDWEYISTDPIPEPLPAGAPAGTPITYKNNPILKINKGTTPLNDIEWVDLYQKLNKFISDSSFLGLGEDKQLGPFFIEFDTTAGTAGDTARKKQFQNKLLHYLWSDVHEAAFKSEVSLFDSSIGTFGDLYKKYGNDEKIFSDDFIAIL